MFNVPQQRVAQSFAAPAPTGGLNDFDPLSMMGDSYMIDCMNAFPDNTDVSCRPGYATHQSDLGSPVRAIMSYHAPNGDVRVFATTNTHIVGIDTAGDPEELIAISSGMMDSIGFSNAGGSYLLAWNGQDSLKYYDGTSWASFVEVVTPDDVGEISGISPNEISYVSVHMARLWFIRKNTMDAYYLPVDSIGGEAKPLYLGSNFTRGGYLVALARWSSDTGRGMDDRFVAITSEGEMAVYTGTDPSDAATWALESVFYLAQPLGPRSVIQNGGDVLILTRRGLVPLSSMIAGATAEMTLANSLTKDIAKTIQLKTASWKGMPFPPEVSIHPDMRWIVINLFDDELGKQVQYVMNSTTGAWGRFDFPAVTMKTINGATYIGAPDGRVLVVTPDSFRDDVDSDGNGGSEISFRFTSSYNYLGVTTALKHAKLIRPVIRSRVPPAFETRVLADFRIDDFDPEIQNRFLFSDALWDVALWDQARWPGDEQIDLRWISANQIGYAFAWQIKAVTVVDFRVTAVQWSFEPGSIV